MMNGIALAQAGAAPPARETKVEWTKLTGVDSLAEIDKYLQMDFAEEPVEVENADGKKATVATCLDFLKLVANGGYHFNGVRSDNEINGSNGLTCYTYQLLKDARPAKKTFLKDFKFNKGVIDLLSPKVTLSDGRNGEADEAEKKGQSLKQFEPEIKVKSAEENKISVETKSWEAEISYLARGDFDGQGLEEILLEVHGNSTVEGARGVFDNLYIMTRSADHGPLKVVREID